MEELAITLLKIGKKLCGLRLKEGYKSVDEFTKEHGLSRMSYWRMERGKTNLTIESLMKVLVVHHITIEEFFAKID
jgi:transcriptional regulator with XRE-family HTH domain